MQAQGLRDRVYQGGIRHAERDDIAEVDIDEVDFVQCRVDMSVPNLDEDQENDRDEEAESGEQGPPETSSRRSFDLRFRGFEVVCQRSVGRAAAAYSRSPFTGCFVRSIVPQHNERGVDAAGSMGRQVLRLVQ